MLSIAFNGLLSSCRLITETSRQAQEGWGGSGDWSEIEVFHLIYECLMCTTLFILDKQLGEVI